MEDVVVMDVDSVSLDRGEDGALVLHICPRDSKIPSVFVRLGRSDPGAPHPIVLVGRGVEAAWVHGLNEGDADSDPRCDLSTTVVRGEGDGILRIMTDEVVESGPHPPTGR